MKPLDFVKTPKGAIAIITEVNDPSQEGMEIRCSISFLGGNNPSQEKNAWWIESDGLEIIDNLPSLLSREMAHPFGTGKNKSLSIYPIK